MVVRGQQDLDANIVRWGLHHLLDAGGGCRATALQSPTTDYAPPPPQPQRARALLDGYDMAPAPAPASDVRVDAVENDEVIAHALQEELAQVAMAEASGADGGEAERRATVLAQQWFRPEVVSHLPSAPPYVEEAESSSPRSSPEEDRNARDGHGCSIELVDDFSALDGEVGKRLNDMVPVPHVPKTNGDIPSFDEAFSDHRRLLDRLVLYGLVELKVNGDGNCQTCSTIVYLFLNLPVKQFRALSDQFYRTPEHHRFVRQQVVNQLESHPEIYAGYVPMDYREYLKKMPKIGEWGDHVTLQAAADLASMDLGLQNGILPIYSRIDSSNILYCGTEGVALTAIIYIRRAFKDSEVRVWLRQGVRVEGEDQEEEEEQLLVARNSGSHTRSINGLVRDAGGFRGHQQQQQQRWRPSPPAVTLSTAPPRKRVSYEAAAFQAKAAAAERVKAEEAPAADHHSVAGVLRDIGEGIKRLERRRMEYGVKIFILTSFRDTCYIEILPVVQKSNRVICLSFWAEVHYNSIYPEGACRIDGRFVRPCDYEGSEELRRRRTDEEID
uniref:OTU domain-containing protein n=1 Tax=Aegilops tauschii TaxID=37682 RepID=N1QYR0_AEGTA